MSDLSPSEPSQMDKVRAARAYLDAQGRRADKQEQLELDAFMAIFHPDHERIVLTDADHEARYRKARGL